MNCNSPATILALLAELARCLNHNPVKINLTPIDPAFCTSGDSEAGAMPKQTSNV